jgi:hypothetical protein
MEHSFLRHAFALVTSIIVLAGCEVSIGGSSVPKVKVEDETEKMLAKAVGEEKSPKITCPGDLKGVVGTTLVCSMPVGDKVADVTLTVTSVEGSNVKWDFKTSPRP